ncbi:MAG: peptidoglycan D,D-transpeptidase FtsI family protein [Chthonomonadales bacterium]
MATSVRPNQSVHGRIGVIFWVLIAAHAATVLRLADLQIRHGKAYRMAAFNSRVRTIPLPATRGDILDRHGHTLAGTTFRSTIVADTTLIRDPQRTAAALAQVLHVPAEELVPYCTRQPNVYRPSPRAVKMPVAISLTQEEELQRLQRDRDTLSAFKGIGIVKTPQRIYPAGREAANVIGILGEQQDGLHGVAGVERSLDSVLSGRSGMVKAEVDARGRVIPGTEVERLDRQDGLTAVLTLDASVQHIAASELAQCCREYHPAGATAIVMDPATGDLLAVVSWPTFDPATRKELVTGRRGMEASPGMEALRNRAVSLFEPGSTMKIITAAAALTEGVITPATRFYCAGEYHLGHHTIRCALHHGERAHGEETIEGVIKNSCNIASAQIGMRLGMGRLEKYLRAFGLLEPTGVELPGDVRGRLGFGYEADRESLAKAARVAFGQSVSVTPLAMATAYAAIANGGILVGPRLVLEYRDPAGRTVRTNPPKAGKRVLTPEMAAYLRTLLEGVVASGTGTAAQVPGYTVAGKTGTAQKVVPGHRGYARDRYVASFIGFVPATKPRALIYVVVDEPHGAYYGAQVAAPVFQRIAQWLMWYWKVPPDNPAGLQKARAVRR